MNTDWHWSGRALAVASLALFAAASAKAQDAVTGELWETTAQTEIAGMPMKLPPYTGKVCQKAEWTEPPQSNNDPSQNCKNTSFNQTGNKITWTVACDNPPMTGDGELTFTGSDAYNGTIRMQAQGMNMQVTLTGKKIGTCDNPQ